MPDENETHAITVRLNALDRRLDERAVNTKDRFQQINQNSIEAAARLAEQLKTTATSIADQLKATADALDKRLHGMNEVRQAMQDQHESFRAVINDIIKTLLPRNEYDIHHGVLQEDMTDFDRRMILVEARRGFKKEGDADRKSLGLLIGTFTSALIAAAVGLFGIIHHW